MDRAGLAAGVAGGAHDGDQAVAERAGRGGEGVRHQARNLVGGEQVAAAGDVRAACLGGYAERLGAGVDGGAALPVDDEQLAILDMRAGSGQDGERFLRARAGREKREAAGAEARVGDVLAGDRPCPGLRIGAARRNRRRGGRDGDAEHAGLGTARHDGERHSPGSGMTAVASISTSHSGRASATTTSPVQTGCTPLMYSPIVR